MIQKTISLASLFVGATLLYPSACLHAQEGEVALAHVKYGFVHIDDTTQRDRPHEEDMMLYIGSSSSMYKSFTMAERIAKAQKAMKDNLPAKLPANAEVRTTHQLIADNNLTGRTLYLLPNQKKAVYSDQIGTKSYLIPTSYATIDWQIGTATKTIGGYECQVATGQFGGRTYTAWFTTELPFPYGPWKLHGLPGLILEAQDASGDVSFSYKGFDKESGPSIPIAIPADASQTTDAAFAKAKKAFMVDPAGALMRSIDLPAGAQVVSSTVVYKDASGNEISEGEAKAMFAKANTSLNTKTANNPLELDNE